MAEASIQTTVTHDEQELEVEFQSLRLEMAFDSVSKQQCQLHLTNTVGVHVLLLKGRKLFRKYAYSFSLQHHFVVVFRNKWFHDEGHVLGSILVTHYCHTLRHYQIKEFEV